MKNHNHQQKVQELPERRARTIVVVGITLGFAAFLGIVFLHSSWWDRYDAGIKNVPAEASQPQPVVTPQVGVEWPATTTNSQVDPAKAKRDTLLAEMGFETNGGHKFAIKAVDRPKTAQ